MVNCMNSRDYFDKVAQDIDARAWRADNAPWANWAWTVVKKEMGVDPGSFIVDLGTGTGSAILNLLQSNSGARFLGVDFSEEMIRRARLKDYGRASVEFRISRIDRLRLPENSVDYFVSAGTFHHIQNKRRVLQNLSDMLKADGKFINLDLFRPKAKYLSEMEELRRGNPEAAAENDRIRQQFQWIYDDDPSHPREFHMDPYDFAQLLEDAGIGPATVHVSLQPGWAVVVGRKAEAPATETSEAGLRTSRRRSFRSVVASELSLTGS